VPDDAAVDTVTQVVVGYVRTSAGFWPFNLDKALEQVCAGFVACFLSKPTMEYPTEGHLGDLIPEEFKHRFSPLPPDGIIAALVKVAIGILRRPSLPHPKPAPVAITRQVVDLFVAGA
jgi:hypothetical protein